MKLPSGKLMIVLKATGVVLSVGSTLLNGWLGKKEQTNIIEKVVDEKLKSKMGGS